MQRLQDSRIDLAELKLHIVKKVGVERCRKYFYYFGRFLSGKVTKSEFDKSCCRLLGRENLSLHNKLVRSILRNASLAKSSPPPQVSKVIGKEDGSEQSGSLIPNHDWSNGVLHKVKPSPLGLNRKVESLLHQPPCREDKGDNRNTDNGFVVASLSRTDEAQEERERLILSVGHVNAPLGIPSWSASVGGPRRTVSVSTDGGFISCYDNGGLSDVEMLRKRMENIAVALGLGGVSAECSSMLNNMLDVYLKKLIKSCVGLGGKSQRQDEIVNRVQPSDRLHIQTCEKPSDIRQEHHPLSLLDFRVAMELNPLHLGQDWPLLRERILMRSFEEQEEL